MAKSMLAWTITSLRHGGGYPKLTDRLHAVLEFVNDDDRQRHYVNAEASSKDAAHRARGICKALGLNTATQRRGWEAFGNLDADSLQAVGMPPELAAYIAERLLLALVAANRSNAGNKSADKRARDVAVALLLSYPAKPPTLLERRRKWKTVRIAKTPPPDVEMKLPRMERIDMSGIPTWVECDDKARWWTLYCKVRLLIEVSQVAEHRISTDEACAKVAVELGMREETARTIYFAVHKEQKKLVYLAQVQR
jgi:hypothetical protein